MALENVAIESKAHFMQAVSHLILNRRKPTEVGARAASLPVLGRSVVRDEEERRKADADRMASDLARAKINIGFAPQLMTQFPPRTYEEIRRGIFDRGILIRDVFELKEVSQVTCTCIIMIMYII
jgi:hypothetical protein